MDLRRRIRTSRAFSSSLMLLIFVSLARISLAIAWDI
jgi:hypothetical protein